MYQVFHNQRYLWVMMSALIVGAGCSEEADNASITESNDKVSLKTEATSTQTATSTAAVNNKPDDWASFRGPTGMGLSGAKGVPTEWSQDKNMLWKIALPGAGASTPIVFNNRVYLTTYTGYLVPGENDGNVEDLERHVLCYNLADGKEIWKKSIKAKLPEERRIRDHGFAANSIAADEDRIYVFLGKNGVYAFDHQGNQQWYTDVGSGTSGWGTAASPVLYKNLVFINASVESRSLIALDQKTGEEKWRVGDIREAWNTPVIIKSKTGKDELVIAKHGKVLSFEPMTGEPLWNCDTDIKWYMVPSLIAHDGVVYALGGRSGIAALAVKTGGSGDVTSTHRLWTSRQGSNVTSPVYKDGHLYWMHESRGIVYCADAKTGEVVYEEQIDRGGQVYGSSILVDGKVYYVNRSGKTFVVAAKPEFELIATNDLRDRSLFNASPAVAGDKLLIRSDKYLYCIGK